MTNIGAALVLSCGLATSLLGMQQPKPDGPKVNAEALVLQDFKTRVDRYMELHKRLEKRTPPLKKVDDPPRFKPRRTPSRPQSGASALTPSRGTSSRPRSRSGSGD